MTRLISIQETQLIQTRTKQELLQDRPLLIMEKQKENHIIDFIFFFKFI